MLSLLVFCFILKGFTQKIPDSTFIHYYPQISSDQVTDICNFHLIPKFNSFNSLELTNVLSKSSTFILAFKSIDNIEKELLNLYSGKESIKINNRIVKRNNDTICKISNPSNGSIITYQFEFNKLRKKNGLSCKEFINTADSSDALLEFYYFPQILTFEERGIIESSLSIKYGISLFEDAMYYNSLGDTIWNSKCNAGFNHLVTGIGRDDELKLNQKQSSNSQDQALCIGFDNIELLNENNNAIIDNRTYVFWGTNSSSQTIENQGDILSFNKKWKIVAHSLDSLPVLCFKASKERIFLNSVPKEGHDYWMVVYDSLSSTATEWEYYCKKDTTNESVVFNFNACKEDKYFSFLIAPKMFATYETIPECEGSNLSILKGKIVGGIGPYNITLIGGVEKNIIQSKNGRFSITKVQSGNYSFIVTDAIGNQCQEAILIKTDIPSVFYDSTIAMNKNGEVRILPRIYQEAGSEYAWQGPGGFVSNSIDITANQAGEYSCKITNIDGCESNFYVNVIDENLKDEIVVYPNPVLAANNFNIEVRTNEISDIKISITDINGKIIDNIQRKKIDYLTLKIKLFIRGNYYLNIEIGNNKYIRKIIVI